MINTDDFIKRLEIILDYYGLNASSFADKIGVQRSSLSHLLSGRNKPSLDFILKILDVFPEVDLYWILNGKGSFPKSETVKEHFTNPAPVAPSSSVETIFAEKTIDLFSEELPLTKTPIEESVSREIPNSMQTILPKDKSAIDRIVVFYNNGTFKTYSPE